MKKLLDQLKRDGQVILESYADADQLREAAIRTLIGQQGFGGVTIRRIKMTAAVTGRDGVHGYKVMAI